MAYSVFIQRSNNALEQILVPAIQTDGKRVFSKTGKATGRPAAEFPEEWGNYYSEWKGGNITAKKCMDDMEFYKKSDKNKI